MERSVKNKTNVILIAILLFSFSIRLPALFIPHIENDEVIYQVLADKVAHNPFDYSVRGTYIFDQLPKSVYDYPLFHHPPIFIYSLSLIKIIFGSKWEIFLPILAAVFTSLAVFLIGKELYSERVGLLASFFFSVCPISLHTSTKIWLDSLLGLFCALSIYCALRAVKKEVFTWYILSGISLGLAILTKCTALGIVPAVVYILFKNGFSKKNNYGILILGIVTIFITAPWFFLFYKTFHAFLPRWAGPNAEAMWMFSFLKMTAERPIYFYLTNTVIVAPIYIFGFIEIIRRFKSWDRLTEVIWAVSFIAGFTIIGALGILSYITRFIVPGLPALALLSASFLENRNKFFWLLAGLFSAYCLSVGILNAYLFQVADVFSLPHFMGAIK